MAIGDIKRMRRGILSALRPLTGDFASGSVLATATGDDVTVPKNCHLVPIPASSTGQVEIAHDLPFRTSAEIVVSSAGTVVPVASLLGGAQHNLPLTTRMRWDPQLTDLEEEVVVTGAALSGGANPTSGPGLVKEVRAFETLESMQVAQDLFAGQVGRFPALIIAYGGSQELDELGDDTVMEAHRWRIYAITSWGSQATKVGDEALDILDAVKSYLVRRTSSHQLVFSQPPARITGVNRIRVLPTVFVWALDMETHMALERTDHRPIEVGPYQDWHTTRIRMNTATVARPVPLPIVDLTTDMFVAGGAFGQAFGDAFDGGF